MGAAADHPTTRFAIRTMAGRDLALGLGTLRALDQDEGARTWVLAGALVDGVDAAASLPGGAPLGHGAGIRDGDRGRLRSSSRGGGLGPTGLSRSEAAAGIEPAYGALQAPA